MGKIRTQKGSDVSGVGQCQPLYAWGTYLIHHIKAILLELLSLLAPDCMLTTKLVFTFTVLAYVGLNLFWTLDKAS